METPDRLPYKQRIVCSRCGQESLVESAVGGVLFALALDRYFRAGCPKCEEIPSSGPADRLR
jgi:hypothetical protein